MRALTSPSDSAPLLRLCAQPEFGLDPKKLREQLATAKRDTTLYALLQETAAGKRVIAAIAEMNKRLPAQSTRAGAYLAAVLQRFGFEAASKAMRTFATFIANWEEKPIAGEGSVLEFLDYLDLFRDFGGVVPLPREEDEDAVRLMTVHTAKGREFRHVYVIRVSQNSFPTSYREVLFEFPRELRGDIAAGRESKELHAEEERRLFYVAMTRAKDTLTLMAKKDWRTKKVPSTYLREMLETREAGLPWEERAPRAFTTDMAASTAPALSAVEPWLMLTPRAEVSTMALSASSIEAYETCPLKFKIRYDWRLPEGPTAALQYGGIIHALLKQYFEQVGAGNPPTDEQVLAQFRAELATAKIDDPTQRMLYERDGIQQLTDFLAARRADAGSFEVLSTEKQFRVEIAGVTVTGRIDRIDRMADGTIQVVDYKTGKAQEEKDAKESLQLSIYALAAPKIDPAWKPDRLVLYNLVTNAPVSAKRTPEALRKAEEKVRKVAEDIRAGRFMPDAGYHCRWCGYKDLCPATEEKLVQIEKLVTAGGVN
jgi:DNA helicase-2/ATP-dependent DNA helicase PcrA